IACQWCATRRGSFPIRYGSISFTASAHVRARPSVIGSPKPTIPAFVCTLRNNHRGFTRKVSSLVTLRLSFGEMGASFPARCCATAAARSKAASPTLANAPETRERRFMGFIDAPVAVLKVAISRPMYRDSTRRKLRRPETMDLRRQSQRRRARGRHVKAVSPFEHHGCGGARIKRRRPGPPPRCAAISGAIEPRRRDNILAMLKRLLIALSLLCVPLPAQAPPDDLRFTGDGQLMRPDNYREWIYLSSGLGITYGPIDSAAAAPSAERFDNVFVTPLAYKAFLQTGSWPDKTMFALEVRYSASKGSIN